MSISRASRRARLALAAVPLVVAGSAVAAGPAVAAAPVSPLRFSTVHLKGTKGLFSWDVAIPRSSGPGRAAAIDRRVRASAAGTIDGTARDAAGNHSKETLTGVSAVTTNDGRTVQVRLDYNDYLIGAAHSTDVVNTVALVAATGAPITLDQVFRDRTAALKALKPAIEAIASAKGEPVTEESGLAPLTSNWAAWQTTPAGMVFAFEDYQLGGHGIRTYTVPWSVVRPLMTPSARALLAP